jgi:16S rRNA (guanine527-N7)-methyltransferase
LTKTISSGWRKTINKNELAGLIKSAVSGLDISDGKVDKIADYTEFVLEKNQSLNLMSRQLDVNTVVSEHIYDCLAPWNMFKKFSSVTDLGTGAGMPGILLAILLPETKIVLIEKSIKKSMFLHEVVEFLGLKNILIENKTVPEVVIKTEVITCRAFKPLMEILSMTKSYFNGGGKYVLYKGRMDKITEEISEANSKFKFKYEIIKTAPGIEKERHVILLNK